MERAACVRMLSVRIWERKRTHEKRGGREWPVQWAIHKTQWRKERERERGCWYCSHPKFRPCMYIDCKYIFNVDASSRCKWAGHVYIQEGIRVSVTRGVSPEKIGGQERGGGGATMAACDIQLMRPFVHNFGRSYWSFGYWRARWQATKHFMGTSLHRHHQGYT